MNVEEFISDVQDSGLKPDDFDVVYKEFCSFRRLALETLKVFHDICLRNQIDYQLAFGSLLGAVRDDGQIPWDYDVDVFVPIVFREKLIDCLQKELGQNYYVVSPQTNKKCRHEIMRISPKGYRSEELHVDVFFLIGLPEDELQKDAMIKQLMELSRKRFYKCVSLRGEWHGSIRKTAGLLLRKIKYLNVNLSKCDREFEELALKYPLDKCITCTTADSWANVDVIPYALLKETINWSTSDGDFIIPKKYKEVLTSVYGNYFTIPDIRSRINDIYYHYNLIKKYGTVK